MASSSRNTTKNCVAPLDFPDGGLPVTTSQNGGLLEIGVASATALENGVAQTYGWKLAMEGAMEGSIH
ncbi:3336_t:CDS:2 [Acaulospora colombiana]|uniref:3336_t:CDS:1 n=1 Tax=Acaulospora colombiana TaxID=27376 RepID=A0ACA9M786_9GLOM|nr:3336_t:CDS:2 [Acaulospora colombiana]